MALTHSLVLPSLAPASLPTASQATDNPAVQLQGPFIVTKLVPPPAHRNVVLIAAGTGINPMVQQIRDYLALPRSGLTAIPPSACSLNSHDQSCFAHPRCPGVVVGRVNSTEAPVVDSVRGFKCCRPQLARLRKNVRYCPNTPDTDKLHANKVTNPEETRLEKGYSRTKTPTLTFDYCENSQTRSNTTNLPELCLGSRRVRIYFDGMWLSSNVEDLRGKIIPGGIMVSSTLPRCFSWPQRYRCRDFGRIEICTRGEGCIWAASDLELFRLHRNCVQERPEDSIPSEEAKVDPCRPVSSCLRVDRRGILRRTWVRVLGVGCFACFLRILVSSADATVPENRSRAYHIVNYTLPRTSRLPVPSQPLRAVPSNGLGL